MKDHPARLAAGLALVVALAGGSFAPASADSLSEPDAYALTVRVDDLDQRIADLEAGLAETDSDNAAQHDTIDDILAAIAPVDCLAFSTYHGYRETLGPNGKKYRTFPIMLWNVAAPGCKPTKAEFKGRRVARAAR